MFDDALKKLGDTAKLKISLFNRSAFRYFLLSVMAGVFIGFGVILVYLLAAPFNESSLPNTRLIMSIMFSIALSLVIFSGAELFTGNVMTFTVGFLRREVKAFDAFKAITVCYIGNFAGSILTAYAAVTAGLFYPNQVSSFILQIAALKMSLPPEQLFVRAILCNMLVCLAVWMSSRTKDDTAKILLITLCIITFFASGFEHSIANMSTLAIALIIPHGADISLMGYCYNLVLASIGNVIGGAVLIGGFYHYVNMESSK